MDLTGLELRAALRLVGRHRMAATAGILVVGLAIGGNAAIFAVLEAVLAGGLGMHEADRVVHVWTTTELPDRGRVDFCDAFPNHRLLVETSTSFSALAATLQSDVVWRDRDESRRLAGTRVTPAFFEVVGVRPAAGRFFSASENGPDAPAVAVISHALWRARFGGSSAVVGRTIEVSGAMHTIVGVAPERFNQPGGTEIWLPFDIPEQLRNKVVGARQLMVYARLAPGVTHAAADLELRDFAVRAAEMDPENRDWGWRVQPLREALLDGADRTVFVVQGGAVILFLLACTNLASLLFSWGGEVRRDTAIRLALGAQSACMRRNIVILAAIPAVAGGIVGLGLAAVALPLIKQLNPTPALAPLLEQASLEAHALVVTVALVVATVLLASAIPAWHARRASGNADLRAGARNATPARGVVRWQQSIVVAQVAVSSLILIGAAVAGLAFLRLSEVDLGFSTDHRVVVRVQFPERLLSTHVERAAMVRRLEDFLAGAAGVRGFGVTSTVPVGDLQWGGGFLPEMADGSFRPDEVLAHYRRVTPGYLPALGVTLSEGRMIGDGDRLETQPVAVVSETFARRYWPGMSAVGRRLRRIADPDATPLEVVGVVSDVRDAGAAQAVGETVYVPFDQLSTRRASVLLVTAGSVKDAMLAAKRAMAAASPDLAVADAAALDDLVEQANALPRMQSLLLSVFGVISAGITALGSFGVMNQIVQNRRCELAIRAALGATPRAMRFHVLGLNGRLVLLGLAAGTGVAWLMAGPAEAVIPGIQRDIIWPLIGVPLGVLLVTQAASWIPAVRAARTCVRELLATV